jgi:citrate lyase beta subunit
MRHLQLGASLYVPATHKDLVAVGNRVRYPFLRSLIYCTEDAVRGDDVPRALAHLADALPRLAPTAGLLRFIRPRDPLVLRELLGMGGIERIDGFVLPKLNRRLLDSYLGALAGRPDFLLMPTLETIDVFDVTGLAALRDCLRAGGVRERILAVRIGGNDLLSLLGLRRPAGKTVYATPLGAVITQIVLLFRPFGLPLTAPVFEDLDRTDVLAREVQEDLAHGLVGKTAIHPDQVPLIEAAYSVPAAEAQLAERILAPGAPAVFRCQGIMCEPSTHRAWAAETRERARLYGVQRHGATLEGAGAPLDGAPLTEVKG